jgi:hypothetical protein
VYVLCVCVLYFGLFNPLEYSPLLPTPHFSTFFNTHSYIVYLHILGEGISNGCIFLIIVDSPHGTFPWNTSPMNPDSLDITVIQM